MCIYVYVCVLYICTQTHTHTHTHTPAVKKVKSKAKRPIGLGVGSFRQMLYVDQIAYLYIFTHMYTYIRHIYKAYKADRCCTLIRSHTYTYLHICTHI